MTQFSKKLPIGIQTFSNLIREGYAYVDKTPFIKQLEAAGKYYFLSRPRRFGKSLFLSTIKSAFLGERELFANLYIQRITGTGTRVVLYCISALGPGSCVRFRIWKYVSALFSNATRSRHNWSFRRWTCGSASPS